MRSNINPYRPTSEETLVDDDSEETQHSSSTCLFAFVPFFISCRFGLFLFVTLEPKFLVETLGWNPFSGLSAWCVSLAVSILFAALFLRTLAYCMKSQNPGKQKFVREMFVIVMIFVGLIAAAWPAVLLFIA